MVSTTKITLSELDTQGTNPLRPHSTKNITDQPITMALTHIPRVLGPNGSGYITKSKSQALTEKISVSTTKISLSELDLQGANPLRPH